LSTLFAYGGKRVNEVFFVPLSNYLLSISNSLFPPKVKRGMASEAKPG
jgi:hypothetical protein